MDQVEEGYDVDETTLSLEKKLRHETCHSFTFVKVVRIRVCHKGLQANMALHGLDMPTKTLRSETHGISGTKRYFTLLTITGERFVHCDINSHVSQVLDSTCYRAVEKKYELVSHRIPLVMLGCHENCRCWMRRTVCGKNAETFSKPSLYTYHLTCI